MPISWTWYRTGGHHWAGTTDTISTTYCIHLPITARPHYASRPRVHANITTRHLTPHTLQAPTTPMCRLVLSHETAVDRGSAGRLCVRAQSQALWIRAPPEELGYWMGAIEGVLARRRRPAKCGALLKEKDARIGGQSLGWNERFFVLEVGVLKYWNNADQALSTL